MEESTHPFDYKASPRAKGKKQERKFGKLDSNSHRLMGDHLIPSQRRGEFD